MANLLDSALDYAAKGHPVFPCAPGGKKPACEHGFKDATTDLKIITDWWSKTPNANIGLPCGYAFSVLDFDVKTGGLETLERLETEHGHFATLWASTPSGGRHAYFLHDPEKPFLTRAGILPGMDGRGPGGYVVVPPSRNGAGSYAFIPPRI